MKSLALENYGVQEMSYQEQNETEGGGVSLMDLVNTLMNVTSTDGSMTWTFSQDRFGRTIVTGTGSFQ